MTQFLEASCLPVIWVIAVLELVILAFSIFRYVKTKSVITLLTACITFGLFYDALIIALGGFVDPSAAPFISRLRFVSHGLLIPLLFPVCVHAMDLKKPWNLIIYGVTGVLMVAGLAEAIATKLDVVTIAGIARMASVKGVTPKWAETISSILSFGTVIPMMAAGIYVWIKQKNPFLFLSGFLMFAFSALGPATGNAQFIFYISMYGELLMVAFMLLYAIKKEKKWF
ncbi:MAG: hypothetical protein MJ220_04345 [Bacilli bacterium]|nr:hypothetical protein [Bacilli bacterium]